jgi:hypothetical protein
MINYLFKQVELYWVWFRTNSIWCPPTGSEAQSVSRFLVSFCHEKWFVRWTTRKQVNWPLLAIGVERKRKKTKVTTPFSFGNNREFREKKKSSFLMFPSKWTNGIYSQTGIIDTLIKSQWIVEKWNPNKFIFEFRD